MKVEQASSDGYVSELGQKEQGPLFCDFRIQGVFKDLYTTTKRSD